MTALEVVRIPILPFGLVNAHLIVGRAASALKVPICSAGIL